MIWLSIWLPDRMPRSVETSKMTVWVGICSLMVFRTTESFASCVRFRNRSETGSPRTVRFSIVSPSTFANDDLPEPKKPDTQTAMPSCGFCGVSWYRSNTSTKCRLMASVTTYSSTSAATMSSAVWSTLMTSSICRLMSLANSVAICVMERIPQKIFGR